jgi:hypothetical protein
MATYTNPGTTSTVVGKQPDSWFASFKRQGFYARQVAIVTILGGLYMHITRLFLGDDLVLRYVFTPLYDRVLTMPMLYAGVVLHRRQCPNAYLVRLPQQYDGIPAGVSDVVHGCAVSSLYRYHRVDVAARYKQSAV